MTRNLNRRQFVGGASAAAFAVGGIGITAAYAQDDATPAPDSGIHPEASPAPEMPALPAVPPELTDSETNWAVEGQNLAMTREAQGSAISTETVGTLGLAWSYAVDNAAPFGALVANPIVVGTNVFLQDAMSNVYVLDIETGEEVWTRIYNQDVPSGGPNGIAVAYGMVFYPVGGVGEVVAVNAETGEDIWSTIIGGPRGEGVDMAPSVANGIVYISTIPGNPEGFYQAGQRGVIHALDANTGDVIWYFDTTTDNLWGNSMVNSGGGLWHPPAIDENGVIYAGTGNASPYPGTADFPAGSSRPGDNDYTNSIIAIDPKTAGLIWNLNVKPHDLFDLDNQLSPMLVTASIDGADRNIAVTSGKHGIVVAVDRETGEEIWRTPVGKHQNDDLQEVPADESIEVYPGTLGGVETPMAYANGVVYAPVLNLATWYTASELDAAKLDFTGGSGELVALDVTTGEILWSAEIPTGLYGAATVANDVIFTGGLDGVARGFSAADGTQVWTGQTTAGLNAPFAISGDYLLVPAGGFLVPSDDTANPAPERAPALFAFKLGAASTDATPTA